MTAAFLRN